MEDGAYVDKKIDIFIRGISATIREELEEELKAEDEEIIKALTSENARLSDELEGLRRIALGTGESEL